MNKLSDFLNNLSLKTILTINILLAIIVFIPLTVYLSGKETRLGGKAYEPLPTIPFLQPTATPLPTPFIPDKPPEIYSIFPFYGKTGDAVIISGKNFGNQKDQILFNNILATQIQSWENEKIVVLVPKGATSGNITVKNIASPFPFTVFDQNTTCQIVINKDAAQNRLKLENCPLVNRVYINIKDNLLPQINDSLKDKIKMTQTVINNESFYNLEVNPLPAFFTQDILSFSPQGKLNNVSLYKDNSLLPFYINPLSL